MRIVFFGTPDLAVPSLAAVTAHHDVRAVVCQPDRPRGRGRQPQAPPVKQWANEHGLSVEQPTKLNDGAFETWLRNQRPQLCALVAYGRILKQPILDVPEHGFLNVHPSLLPKYRGPSPIQSALLNGETETGVTIMRLDAGMDTGDMVVQAPMPIEPEDTTATLSNKLAELGAELLIRAIDQVECGEARFTPQDHSAATYTEKFEKADGRIRWSDPAKRVVNRIRAANPWPVAECLYHGQTLRLHEAQVAGETSDEPPGTILRADDRGIAVAAGDGAVLVTLVQAPGKRPLPAAEFLRGRSMSVGDLLEDA